MHASAALQGLLARPQMNIGDAEHVCKLAAKFADEMMKLAAEKAEVEANRQEPYGWGS